MPTGLLVDTKAAADEPLHEDREERDEEGRNEEGGEGAGEERVAGGGTRLSI